MRAFLVAKIRPNSHKMVSSCLRGLPVTQICPNLNLWGSIDSKMFKNSQELSKIWSFSRWEVAWLLLGQRETRMSPLGVNWLKYIQKRSRIMQNMIIFKGRGCMTLMRTRGRTALPFWVNWLKNVQKWSRIKQNMVILKGRGCVTPMRTRGRRALPLGVKLTQKYWKTVKD